MTNSTTPKSDIKYTVLVREAFPDEAIELATFVYKWVGPVAKHNYLCAYCRSNSAVLICNTGVLQPCWECQKTHRLVKLNWLDRLLGRHKL